MFDMEKTMEQMKTRQRATEYAKKDIFQILNWVSEIMTDAITTEKTENSFKLKVSWNGNNGLTELTGQGNFKIENGKAVMIIQNGEKFDGKIIIYKEDIDYINVKEAKTAIEKLLESLQEIETFEESEKTLKEIVELIGK